MSWPDVTGARLPVAEGPRSPSPALLRVWRLQWLAALALVLLVAVVMSVVLRGPGWLSIVAVAAVAAIAAGTWLGAAAAWRARSYSLGTWSLDLRHGVVTRSVTTVPYHRIQQIDLRRGPLERHYGISTLVLRTAAATTDSTMPGIPLDEAGELRVLLLQRAGITDAV